MWWYRPSGCHCCWKRSPRLDEFSATPTTSTLRQPLSSISLRQPLFVNLPSLTSFTSLPSSLINLNGEYQIYRDHFRPSLPDKQPNCNIKQRHWTTLIRKALLLRQHYHCNSQISILARSIPRNRHFSRLPSQQTMN
ncbi:hypothetical protein ONS95_008313 [Cadophora gregata]|uniref:uncharacterized protein n=1 Tax=Cadophora gregata TaxID=51156 RepID=UPI0026DCB8EC|nr:uncharacterized protein ONS95_008313 [Cadophora gregata]KAK0100360.1 hypothetical protein ONS96_007640 [Cadophora gregata f. sp. sojae]KAK0126733.1 hypothetical protein ONS95_008313 [Cadophora gregata]